MMKYAIATAENRRSKMWRNRQVTWEELAGMLANNRVTGETMAEYRAMKKDDQDDRKDVGGFVGGHLRGGVRNAASVTARSLLTLDMDDCTETAPLMVDVTLAGTAYVMYSTHKHTTEKPRLRLVLPLSREVTPEEYVPIARRIAETVGIDMFDDSTYEPARLMYWPSSSVDGEVVYTSAPGAEVDVERVLASYRDWRDVSEWPVSSRVQAIVTRRADKAEDPRTKSGIVGAFCRTYDVPAAIATFLSDIYTEGDKGRYTYTHGSTSNGVRIYDDGRFAYSSHATDPASGRNLNAFDLVRLHLYGELDTDAREGTPVASMPSFQAMRKLASEDEAVRRTMAAESYAEASADFAEVLSREEDTEWMGRLKRNKGGALVQSIDNARIIIDNDPRLRGKVVRDAFTHRDLVVADLPWRKASTKDIFWSNEDNDSLLCYMSADPWQMEGKEKILTALNASLQNTKVHPVRDYLATLTWDGTPRLDTLMVDYLGAEDSELTRAMTRKVFTAAVARIEKPGTKFDYVMTLVGPEGIGKSTIIRNMGRQWYSDSLITIEGKEGMEAVQGKWLIEIGELTSYKKSTAEMYKAFLSKQEDVFRPAFARSVEIYPRQCVFFATTNEDYFLKGDTGNRRWWCVTVGVNTPTKDVWAMTDETIGQIWAEAKHRYAQGEKLYLDERLEVAARKRQAENNEVEGDERKGMIQAFLMKPVPAAWPTMPPEARRQYIISADLLTPEGTEMREYVCATEILVECFGEKIDGMTKYKTREINAMLRSLGLKETGRMRGAGPYGLQRYYDVREWLENVAVDD